MRSVIPSCLIAALPLGACASATGPVDTAGTFFEIEYVNFAWIPTWQGAFIDSTGAIHRYDLEGSVVEGPDDEYVPAAELQSKWQRNREQAGRIPAGDFAQLANLVPAAADGRLSANRSWCADAGTVTYRAYRYEDAHGAFRRVTLRREGDVAQRNESAAAAAIAQRLLALDLAPRFPDCAP